MDGAWDGIEQAQDAALAGSSIANAVYFSGRVAGLHGSRRFAALVLATLFSGIGLEAAAAALGVPASGPAGVVLGAPLLAGSAATSLLIAMGGRR